MYYSKLGNSQFTYLVFSAITFVFIKLLSFSQQQGMQRAHSLCYGKAVYLVHAWRSVTVFFIRVLLISGHERMHFYFGCAI